jgi:hypothetical protein
MDKKLGRNHMSSNRRQQMDMQERIQPGQIRVESLYQPHMALSIPTRVYCHKRVSSLPKDCYPWAKYYETTLNNMIKTCNKSIKGSKVIRRTMSEFRMTTMKKLGKAARLIPQDLAKK